MRKFKTSYDFYKLEEFERISLVGKLFIEEGFSGLYLPFLLENKWENYGIAQGVLYISDVSILRFGEHAGEFWFKVGSFSPDYLDIDLCFHSKETELRDKVIEFLISYSTSPTSYKELLKLVQEEFKAGELYE